MVAVRCNLWFEEEVIQCDRGCHGAQSSPRREKRVSPVWHSPGGLDVSREDRQAEAQD